MRRMLINAAQTDELRVAVVDGHQLVFLDIEHPEYAQKKSNIYKGRITSIEPSLDAVFVDYGLERHGFLPMKEISPEYFLTPSNPQEPVDISKLLKVGQALVVQIEKEERGTKGAALTTFISLAGSYLVLMPNNPRAHGVSRRIEGDERDQLKERLKQLQVPEGMGMIVRTAGVDQVLEELQWDLDILLRYWEAIKQAAVAQSGTYLIHQESNIIIRTMRDYLRREVEEIVIDEPEIYEQARQHLIQVRPDYLPRLKLYSDPLPLFSYFQVEQQIEKAYQREVRLPSGGSLSIDATEALIAIDVNSARATRGGNIEETAYTTNMEAAEEIAKQLRIRDVGGLIVIDFIDMAASANRRAVRNRLDEALQCDRARTRVGRHITEFGLLEMSRQRLHSALTKTTQISCPRCSGHGTIRNVESIATSIIHLLQEQAARGQDLTLQIQLPIDVSTYILNEKRNVIRDIEARAKVQILVLPNSHLHSPQYQIRAIPGLNRQNIPSYKVTKVFRADPVSRGRPPSAKKSEPIVNQYLTGKTPSAPKRPTEGIIRRLWKLMFGPDVSLLPELKKEEVAEKRSSSQHKPPTPPAERRQSVKTGGSAARSQPHYRDGGDTGEKRSKSTSRGGSGGGGSGGSSRRTAATTGRDRSPQRHRARESASGTDSKTSSRASMDEWADAEADRQNASVDKGRVD